MSNSGFVKLRKDSFVVLSVISLVFLASIVSVFAFPNAAIADEEVVDSDGLAFLNSLSPTFNSEGFTTLVSSPVAKKNNICRSLAPSGTCVPGSTRCQLGVTTCSYRCDAGGNWDPEGRVCDGNGCNSKGTYCVKAVPVTQLFNS